MKINKKLFLPLAIAAALILIASGFVLATARKHQSAAVSGNKEAAAEDKTGQGPELSVVREVKVLTGVVDGIDGGKIKFTVNEGQVEEQLRKKTAVINSDTYIEVRKQKGEEEKQADASGESEEVKKLLLSSAEAKQALYACMAENPGVEKPNVVCKEESDKMYEINGRITDLRAGATPAKPDRPDISALSGEKMQILAEAQEDISNKEEFSASRIEILVMNGDNK